MKYKHPHDHLIRLWLDNLETIEFEQWMGNRWHNAAMGSKYGAPILVREIYRIRPLCNYAIEQVSELNPDKATELVADYTSWVLGDASIYLPAKQAFMDEIVSRSCPMSYYTQSIKANLQITENE